MHSLLYISNSTSPFTREDIIHIIGKYRENKTNSNITGLLLYHQGSILQVLEGEKEKVHELFYNKISKDRRHKGFILLIDDETDKRNFADCITGFNKSQHKEWSEIQGCVDIGNKNEFL